MVRLRIPERSPCPPRDRPQGLSTVAYSGMTLQQHSGSRSTTTIPTKGASIAPQCLNSHRLSFGRRIMAGLTGDDVQSKASAHAIALANRPVARTLARTTMEKTTREHAIPRRISRYNTPCRTAAGPGALSGVLETRSTYTSLINQLPERSQKGEPRSLRTGTPQMVDC